MIKDVESIHTNVWSLPQTRSITISQLMITSLLWISAIVDLPQNISIFGSSISSMLTFALVFMGILTVCAQPEFPRSTRILLFFVAMVFWGAGSFLWGDPGKQGIQNFLVILMFILCLFIAAKETNDDSLSADKILTTIQVSSVFTMFIYLMVSQLSNGREIMFPRAFAIFALIALCVHLSRARYKHKLSIWMSIVTVLMVGYSLSRTATVVALILVALSMIRFSFMGIFRMTMVTALTLYGLYYAVMQIPQLQQRFFTGDLSMNIAGVPINAMGRVDLWEVTLIDISKSPIIGHGVGTAEQLIKSHGFVTSHPHNDYLRIWHDYGLIGLLCWSIGITVLFIVILRAWNRADKDKSKTAASIHFAAWLSLLAVAAMMITDNPFVYSFVMAPLGILAGASLGLIKRKEKRRIPAYYNSKPEG